jgi:glyoxylase-like metal-dependent hydrolase (beta-lactamase superfamily II)
LEEEIMTTRIATIRVLLCQIACALSAPFLTGVAFAEGMADRMYVFECGESKTTDVSKLVARRECRPVAGVQRQLLSDQTRRQSLSVGLRMSDAIAAKPEGVSAGGGILTLWVRKPFGSQLQALGIAPGDITHVAFSHSHGDHVGNANLFTAATLYIQEAEYEAAFGANPAKYGFAPTLYEKLKMNQTVKINGDLDVFGDGSVVILSTPGHTPGHQSLLVRLPKRGVVVLSGDMVHFQDNWIHRRVPTRNFDKEQSLQSMERVAKLLEANHGELWINHDKDQSARIPKAPDYVE